MPGFSYNLEQQDLFKLQEYFYQLPGIAEDVVNDAIHNDVAKMTIRNMIRFTPVSKVNKKHAKDSNPYRTIPINLGIFIEERIDYLVYPELGIGQPAQSFMYHGFYRSEPYFMEMIMDALTKAINE